MAYKATGDVFSDTREPKFQKFKKNEMIKEIVQFTKALPPETFSRNLQLKEGLYMFLDVQENGLEVVEQDSLWINKKSEVDFRYQEFINRYSASKMIPSKSLNSSEKIFIDIGTPFGISISGKGIKPDVSRNESIIQKIRKQNNASKAYLKAILNFIDFEKHEQLNTFHEQFKEFIRAKLYFFFKKNGMLEFKNGKWEFTFKFKGETKKITDNFVFYFFMKQPTIADYKTFYDSYLSKKVFLYDLKKGETHGISNELTTGNISKKPFMRHKTASFEINQKIDGYTAKELYRFFELKNVNGILPNPCPIFIDNEELNSDWISFHDGDNKSSYKKIIRNIFEKYNLDSLQNYYLFFFQNGLKKTQIVDVDFIPQFKYKTKASIKNVFELISKDKKIKPDKMISNIFEIELLFNQKIFYQSNTKSGVTSGLLNFNYYFSEKIKASKGWIISDNTSNLLYKYRKAIYDYIYKAKYQSITCKMFDDMMKTAILEDIRTDEEYKRSYPIKEKLNIWFSLYNYFNQNQNRVDMANKTVELRDGLKSIIENENLHIESDSQFAFASGQLIWKILIKSKSANRSHALLEPFLQKTSAEQFKLAIANTFDMYKHEFTLYPKKYGFDKLMGDVMGFVPEEKNMKNLLTYILAGYFSDSIL